MLFAQCIHKRFLPCIVAALCINYKMHSSISALLLLSSLVQFARSQNHRVVLGPEALTAPLGTNATFHCIVANGELRWRINNLNIPLSADDVWETAAKPVNGFFRGEFWSNSTVEIGTLLISATLRNNRSVNISCSAFGGYSYPAWNSPNVQLTVFGHPLAPGNVEVEGEGVGQLRLKWSAPFVLPGETVSYSVLVQDLNDTTANNNRSTSISSTVYIHQIPEALTLSCHHFIFSVFSINEVGSSINSSSTEPLVHPSVPGTIEITGERVVFGSDFTIVLQLKIPKMCSPVTLSVEMEEESEGIIICPVMENRTSEIVVRAECGVGENRRYSLAVRAENQFNLSSLSPHTIIYTTDVQWASAVELNNHSLQLTCGFAEGSDARGCQLTIIPSELGKVWIVVRLLRREISGLEAKEVYEGLVEWGFRPSLLVSDIEKDGTTSTIQKTGNISLISPVLPSPAVSDNNIVTSILLPPTASHPNTEGGGGRGQLVVVAVLATVAGFILLLVVFVIICILKKTSSKKTARDRNAQRDHIYEDVDLIANPRYLSHKLDTSSRDSTPYLDAINPLPISPTTGACTYAIPGVPGPEYDAYEVMKPSDPVKMTVSLPTTDNVCYSTV